jgi:membrane protease YdiL (CAAX protease family)
MPNAKASTLDRKEPRRRWLQTLETFVLCLLYVTAFWGQAARGLPAPLDQWYSLPYRAAGPWWHEHLALGLSRREQVALYQLAEAFVFAVLLPAWMLRRRGSSLRDAGVRLPDRTSVWPSVVAVLASLPFGLYFSRVVPQPWGSPIEEGLGLLLVIPEHFLIFGVFAVMLLPGAGLRGFAGERHAGAHEALAVAATAAIFGLVHVGAQPPVLIGSFALGLINGFITVRTASIWPAIGAHWLMNIVPMAWDLR